MGKILRKYILVLFSIGYSCCYAQDSDAVKTVAQDSSFVTVKQFNEGLESNYEGREFNYDREQGEARNLLTQFLDWIFKGVQDALGITVSPGTTKILEIIIYILLGLAVIYLLLRFFSDEKLSSLFSKKAKAINTFNFYEEDIAEVNFQELIQQAVAEKEYRLATRYLYLSSLKALSASQLIAWHFEKTNQEYYQEIQPAEIKSVFKKVSYFFDYVWYGEFPVDAPSFAYAEQEFHKLHQLIKKHGG